MRASKLAVIVAACGTIAACSTYPLPQQVSGSTTQQIVDNVRCEARQGLRQAVIDWLREQVKGGDVYAAQLESRPEAWNDIRPETLPRDLADLFAFYKNSQIAYAFTLQIDEYNMEEAGVGFVGNFATKRRDGLGFAGTSTRTRSVTRTFNIVDTFSDLGITNKKLVCEGPRSVNVLYPITGSLPIRDLIITYLKLNEFGNLGQLKSEAPSVRGGALPAIPQMSDTIKFRTKFEGSANPTFMFNPTPLGFLLSAVTFKTTDYRLDDHSVIIYLSTSADALKIEKGGSMVASARQQPRRETSRGSTLRDARTQSALEGLEAVRQKNVQDAIISIGSSLSGMAR